MSKQNTTSSTSKSEYLILRFAVIFAFENIQEVLSYKNYFFEQMYVIQKCYFKFKVILQNNIISVAMKKTNCNSAKTRTAERMFTQLSGKWCALEKKREGREVLSLLPDPYPVQHLQR